jgi:hypothetical protein
MPFCQRTMLRPSADDPMYPVAWVTQLGNGGTPRLPRVLVHAEEAGPVAGVLLPPHGRDRSTATSGNSSGEP